MRMNRSRFGDASRTRASFALWCLSFALAFIVLSHAQVRAQDAEGAGGAEGTEKPLGPAKDASATPGSAAPKPSLPSKQEAVTRRYESFEKALNRLRVALSRLDPEKSSRLGKAYDAAREAAILKLMDQARSFKSRRT
jgi:hypothetical protein